MHPLVHYIRHGEGENRPPSPLFDVPWYRRQFSREEPKCLLAHFLKEGSVRGFRPVAYFDSAFYLGVNRDVREARLDPYHHYLFTGYREGRRPSRTYSLDRYAARFSLNPQSGISPLAHFLYNNGSESLLDRTASGLTPGHPPRLQDELKRYKSPGTGYENSQLDLIPGFPKKAKLVALYLPQFHPIPENDLWWGKGFTEWSNVTRGMPRFQGHYQPHLPGALGYYDLRNEESMAAQIHLARKAGLYGFCFHYYSFNGSRLLERPINTFLSRKDWAFNFCLIWANENWTRRWDGLDSEILIAQDYSLDHDQALVSDIARHFSDTRYIRIDGRPLLFIYRPGLIPNARERIADWRALFEKAHGEHPLLFMAQGFGNEDPREFGMDGAVEFPPHKLAANLSPINASLHVFDPEFSGTYFAFDDLIKASRKVEPPEFPLIRTVVPSWDNEARRPGRGMGFVGSTPVKYGEWLSFLIDFAQKHPLAKRDSFVFINAWNEWAEGVHLEPDVYWGHAYLNATKRALTGYGDANDLAIIYVGHDAHRHGAQLLSLNIVKTLVRAFGIRVEVVLLEGGALTTEFQDIAPTHVVNDETKFSAVVEEIQARTGARYAICNTTVTGECAAVMKQMGFSVISLVHELAYFIKERRLERQAKAIATFSDQVLFATEEVRNSFESVAGKTDNRAVVRPQGIYQDLTLTDDAADAFRRTHGIPPSVKVVINAGFGDLRKGYDLFVRIAQSVTKSNTDVYFVWLGQVDANLAKWLEKDIATISPRFLQLPFSNEVAAAIACAEVFCLTSREDPFPSVVLEALALGVPVLGFEGAGGFAELLSNSTYGELVPYSDVERMSEAIARWISTDTDAAAEIRKQTISGRYRWHDYVFSLVETLCPEIKRISVIVPNYNCVLYLEQRLRSIIGQRYPIYELIILDDVSSDASLSKIKEVLTEAKREAKLVINEQNSGSAFHQWEKGAQLARGDYLWIAEADDSAKSEFLSELVQQLDEDVVLAFSDSAQIDEYGEPLARDYQYYYATVQPKLFATSFKMRGEEFVKKGLSIKNLILNVSSILVRRLDFLDAVSRCRAKILGLKLAGDWFLYATLLSDTDVCVAFVSEPLNIHRRHGKSITSMLDRERHLMEIVEVQDYISAQLDLPLAARRSAEDYRSEIKEQFGLT